ncbi:MAG: radical SAM protein [Candidatus Hydrogenedentota bacterium]|nr:MAG: radical SAM protein [Candidatus Hydrogenedentota bacterium]
MGLQNKASSSYGGFEQGPIRPPSEVHSLLIRVTRNCPWNRCAFCPVYKKTKFSVRPVSHVKRDIDCVYEHVETLRQMAHHSGAVPPTELDRVAAQIPQAELQAFAAAVQWFFAGGMRCVFLQDADALVTQPADLVEILGHLKRRFASVERITSYSRAQTIAARKDSDLKAIHDAGLDRIHVGLESGSDQVLKRVTKGITKEKHIIAGLKAKSAGMELSEYVMPGLGGTEFSEIHALETADALNRIDPDFIRIRTLAVPRNVPLFQECEAGRFEKCSDLMVAKEILMLIEELDGITSVVKSDHILNLFGDLEGTLPHDKEHMTGMLRTYLAMDPQRQRLYQVGRRLGIFSGIGDMENPGRMGEVERVYRELAVTPANVDRITDEMMTRYL